MALAQNARAGAFLVIPALVLVGARLAPRGKRIRSAALLLGSAALAFTLNFGMLKALAGTAEGGFSNWSYTLYGQAVGGKGWQQAALDHPEIEALDERGLTWQAVLKNPAGLAAGARSAWQQFLRHPGLGAFGSVWMDLANPSTWLLRCLWALTLAGFRSPGTRSLRRRAFPWLRSRESVSWRWAAEWGGFSRWSRTLGHRPSAWISRPPWMPRRRISVTGPT